MAFGEEDIQPTSASGAPASPAVGAQPTGSLAAPSAAGASPVPADNSASASAAAPAGPASPAAPASSAAAIKPSQPQQHQNVGQKMLHGILNALGGTEDVQYQRDPQTGKLIVSRASKNPGDQWKRIIAGALMGMSAGASAAPGPGQKARAVGAGFNAGAGMVMQQDATKRQHADEDFEAQSKATVRQAQVAHLNSEIAKNSWETQRSRTEFVTNNAKDTNAFLSVIQSDPNHQDLGVFPSFNDFLTKNAPNQDEIAKMNANGELRAWPEVDKNGKVTGVHVYKVSPANGQWANQKIDRDLQIDFGYGGSDGKWHSEYRTIPKGGMTNGDFATYQQTQQAKRQQYEQNVYDQAQDTKRSAGNNAATVEAAKVGAQGRVDAAAVRASAETAATRTMKESAPKVMGFVDKINKLLDDPEVAKEVGAGEGRLNEILSGKGGLKNPKFIQLRTNAKLLTSQLLRMHVGARGGQEMYKQFDSLVNGAQDIANLRAALGEIRDYAVRLQGTQEGQNISLFHEPPQDKNKVTPPAGASQEVWVNNKLVGHVVGDKYVPLEAKPKQ